MSLLTFNTQQAVQVWTILGRTRTNAGLQRTVPVDLGWAGLGWVLTIDSTTYCSCVFVLVCVLVFSLFLLDRTGKVLRLSFSCEISILHYTSCNYGGFVPENVIRVLKGIRIM